MANIKTNASSGNGMTSKTMSSEQRRRDLFNKIGLSNEVRTAEGTDVALWK